MVKLTFYGGIKEIGGNKILLEDKGTKIFLDFGMSFHRRELYFEEFLTPRTSNGIGDFLAMKLIPDIPGLNENIPLTIKLILTPAWLASYSFSMRAVSVRLFNLRMI